MHSCKINTPLGSRAYSMRFPEWFSANLWIPFHPGARQTAQEPPGAKPRDVIKSTEVFEQNEPCYSSCVQEVDAENAIGMQGEFPDKFAVAQTGSSRQHSTASNRPIEARALEATPILSSTLFFLEDSGPTARARGPAFFPSDLGHRNVLLGWSSVSVARWEDLDSPGEEPTYLWLYDCIPEFQQICLVGASVLMLSMLTYCMPGSMAKGFEESEGKLFF